VRVYDRYILFMAILFMLTTVILSVVSNSSLDLYWTIYIIEALVLTELYVYLNPKARRGLNRISYVLFAGFILIVAKNVMGILSG